jgi:peptidoglycan/LPS O-acetylase OafA/YrhL
LSTLASTSQPASRTEGPSERQIERPMRMGHIRSLDGVRGAAFLLVFLQHFSGGNHIHVRFIEAFRGIGWTGVDLFFCLSGFLITGILYDTQRDPHFYKNFYSRRALRIFPLYYLCLLLIMLTTPFLHLRWHLYHLCYPLYCSNFLNAFVTDGSTFGFPPWIDLGHFWSLAVEEQFYVVWPVAILLCRTPSRIIRLCWSLIALSVMLRLLFVLLYLHQPVPGIIPMGHGLQGFFATMPPPFFYRMFLYRITFFRLDALAIGGIVAMMLRGEHTARWSATMKWLAIPILGVNALTLHSSFHLQTVWTAIIGYTLIAALFGTILIGAIQWKWLRSLFENRALMSVGRYSYAMYLMHQIVRPGMPRLIHQVEHITHSTPLAGAICSTAWLIVLYLLARLSFSFFERRFLAYKSHFPYGTHA